LAANIRVFLGLNGLIILFTYLGHFHFPWPVKEGLWRAALKAGKGRLFLRQNKKFPGHGFGRPTWELSSVRTAL
jgi:hypothetical protein